METKIFVGGIPWATTAEELTQFFTDALGGPESEVGAVVKSNVLYDKVTGKARGFGFVTFSTKEAADLAIEKTNGADYNGRTLKVNMAIERDNSAPRQ